MSEEMKNGQMVFAKRVQTQNAGEGIDLASVAQGRKRQEFPEADAPVVPVIIEGTDKEKRQMAYLINETCKSDYGRQVIQTALENDYKFVFDDSIPDAYGFADPENKLCAMNPTFTTEDLIATMAHELRHVYQFSFPICNECNPGEADAKSNLMLLRSMEADASEYECLVSWDLKEKGLPGAWANFSRDFPEMAKPFEKAMIENEGKPEQIAKARTAAFMGWYDNLPRRVGYDESYVECLQENGPKALESSLKSFKVEDMVAAFCQEKGKSYFTANPSDLAEGYLVATSQQNKDALKRFFNAYNRLPGNAKERSLAEIPVLEKTEKPKAVAKSLPAKQAALEAKQEAARNTIQNKKKDALTTRALFMHAQQNRKNR